MSVQQTHLKVLITNSTYFLSTQSDGDWFWNNKAMGRAYERMACTALKIQSLTSHFTKEGCPERWLITKASSRTGLDYFSTSIYAIVTGGEKSMEAWGILSWKQTDCFGLRWKNPGRFQDHRRVSLRSQLHVNLEISFILIWRSPSKDYR